MTGESIFNKILQFAQIGQTMFMREHDKLLYAIHVYQHPLGGYMATLYLSPENGPLLPKGISSGSTTHEAVINVWNNNIEGG